MFQGFASFGICSWFFGKDNNTQTVERRSCAALREVLGCVRGQDLGPKTSAILLIKDGPLAPLEGGR